MSTPIPEAAAATVAAEAEAVHPIQVEEATAVEAAVEVFVNLIFVA